MLDLINRVDPYLVLGIDKNAGEEEIRRAYLAMIREHSPERDPEGFKLIREAYQKLHLRGQGNETELFSITEEDSDSHVSIHPSPLAPQPLVPEMIKQDILALEALFLLEELYREKSTILT